MHKYHSYSEKRGKNNSKKQTRSVSWYRKFSCDTHKKMQEIKKKTLQLPTNTKKKRGHCTRIPRAFIILMVVAVNRIAKPLKRMLKKVCWEKKRTLTCHIKLDNFDFIIIVCVLITLFLIWAMDLSEFQCWDCTVHSAHYSLPILFLFMLFFIIFACLCFLANWFVRFFFTLWPIWETE